MKIIKFGNKLRDYLIADDGKILESRLAENDQTAPAGAQWLRGERASTKAKIPGGKLSANSYIWFHHDNLVWDKVEKVMWTSKVPYWAGMEDHEIRIKGHHTTEPFRFVEMTIDDWGNRTIIWKGYYVNVRFILSWKPDGSHNAVGFSIS